MARIKISSQVDETIWKEFKQLSRESHQNISDLLTEAIREYLQCRSLRIIVQKHLEDSIRENQKLGNLLSK